MADEHTAEQISHARQVVAAAIAAAGKMDSSVAWKGRINTLIPEVAAILDEKSVQMYRALQMNAATYFEAEFIKFETDYLTASGKKDESKRAQVHLVHDVTQRFPDGVQRIRTHRIDTQLGERQLERLKSLQPGANLACYKVQEALKSGEGETMAVLAHFEERPARKTAPAGVPPAPQPRQAPEGPSTAPSGAPSSPSINEFSAFNDATQDMSGRTKTRFVAWCRENDLWPPSTGNIDAIIISARDWPEEDQ